MTLTKFAKKVTTQLHKISGVSSKASLSSDYRTSHWKTTPSIVLFHLFIFLSKQMLGSNYYINRVHNSHIITSSCLNTNNLWVSRVLTCKKLKTTINSLLSNKSHFNTVLRIEPLTLLGNMDISVPQSPAPDINCALFFFQFTLKRHKAFSQSIVVVARTFWNWENLCIFIFQTIIFQLIMLEMH